MPEVKALYIDYEYCSGCKSCELACKNEHGIESGQWGIRVLEDGPWQLDDGRWHWNYIPVLSELCDLCEERVKAGLEPSCVQHCQAKVLYLESPETLTQKITEKKKAAIFIP